MLYSIPDYYKEFVCTADQCEDTCCAGWQIMVDRKSLDRYRCVRGAFKKDLRRGIIWKEGTFRQSKEKRCAFLDEDNLCRMYKNLGEKSLCRTCRLYPRHIEEFENVREITLSVSCPEVAKLLLKKEEPVRFLSYEKEGEETYEAFDYLLYSMLADAREVMIGIAQNRDKPLGERILLVLGLAHDIERRVRNGNLFTCEELFDKYESEAAEKFVRCRLEHYMMQADNRCEEMRNLFQKLYRLEVLKEDWRRALYESELLLYREGNEAYNEKCRKYEQWMDEQIPDWKMKCEQLFVYFLYTYFCGAVYDARVYGKAQMAAVSVLLISELWKARWIRNEGYLDLEDMTEIVYRYSRELEHSDENLELFEMMMEKTKIFV